MAEEFKFKEVDSEGLQTLDVISAATNLNRWFYETINPYCKGNILEIGSGIGNISQYFLQNNTSITFSDLRDNYLDALRQRFPDLPGDHFLKLDITHPEFDKVFGHLIGTFDTIFALNVVEHIKDDQLAINNCHKLLKKGGNLIILVPAYQFLYNKFDKELEHYRRYTKSSLNALFNKAQFKIIHNQYFNASGILGWYVSGKLQGNNLIPEDQMKLYNTLVPVFRIIDKLIFNSFGLSVITVGTKQ